MAFFLLYYDAIDQYCESSYDYGEAVRLEIIDIFRPIWERPLDYLGDSGENAREGCDGDNGCHDRAHLLLIFLAKCKKSDDGQREENFAAPPEASRAWQSKEKQSRRCTVQAEF